METYFYKIGNIVLKTDKCIDKCILDKNLEYTMLKFNDDTNIEIIQHNNKQQ